MLRDDHIRLGLLKPTSADVKRMNLSKKEVADLKKLRAKNRAKK